MRVFMGRISLMEILAKKCTTRRAKKRVLTHILLLISDIVRGEVFSENVTMQETITLNTQEQKRVMILNRILAGQLSPADAAPLLQISKRQVQRILAAYRLEGVEAVVHGNRGRRPIHRITDEIRQQILTLAQTKYAGCNQEHLRDLLQEREGIKVSRASVHRILAQAGLLAESSRKPVKHRQRANPRRRRPLSGPACFCVTDDVSIAFSSIDFFSSAEPSLFMIECRERFSARPNMSFLLRLTMR